MAAYTNFVLTNQGVELLADLLNGDGELEFRCLAIGSGTYSNAEKNRDTIRDMTKLKDEHQRTQFCFIGHPSEDGLIDLKAEVTNKGLVQGYSVTEIGIYAGKKNDPDEVLYCVSTAAGTPDYMPDFSSKQLYNVIFRLKIGIGDVSNVSISYKMDTYALAEDLDNHMKDDVAHVTVEDRKKWDGKVDKVKGKGLSTNDYTTAEKTKLANIAEGAEVNVQADWSVTDSKSDAYIKNKPTSLPASDVHDWAKAATKPSYTKSEVGLGNVNNTSDVNKPVSTAQRAAIDEAYANSNAYTDEKIAELVGGAPTTLDTLGEIAQAMKDNADVVEALDSAIGKKANEAEFDSHVKDTTAHVTDEERQKWDGKANSSHTHDVMAAATSSVAGKAGFVPAPSAGSQAKYLRGDGTWGTPTNTWQANSKTANGYVAKGDGHSGQVWGTDEEGNPGWVDMPQIPSGLVSGYVRTGQRTSETTGDYSTAEGYNTSAPNKFAHSEGHSSVASGNTSHAEGWESTASGTASHAEGRLSFAEGYVSHAEGTETTSSANNCHAEGYKTAASAHQAHAEGNSTKAEGENSHAEGRNTKATTENSHAEGLATTVSGYTSHAEGWNSTASGNTSHAEGYSTKASGDNSHAEGKNTKAYGFYSHTEGNNTTTGDLTEPEYSSSAHAEGESTMAIGTGAHSEGIETTAAGVGTHAEGASTVASGDQSHVEGWKSHANGEASHAEGWETNAEGIAAHAEGYQTSSTNIASHACGKYNKNMTSDTAMNITSQIGDVFVIGNGTSNTARSNAMRVTYLGDILGTKAFQSSGADYAEYIKPWADGNPNDEDRVGYFVTIKGGLLYKATDGDYIAGITSGNPSIVGNADEDYYWKYARDEFNRIVMEDVPEMVQKTEIVQEAVPKTEVIQETVQKTEIIQKAVQKTEIVQEPMPSLDENGEPTILYISKEFTSIEHIPTEVPVYDEETGEPVMEYVSKEVPVFDENGEPVMECISKEVPVFDEDGNPVMIPTGYIISNARMKLAETYDPSLQEGYVERKYRREWDYVGMLGVLPVRDDSTCQPGKFCKCGEGGVATLAQVRGFDTYMVLERVSSNIIKVVLK